MVVLTAVQKKQLEACVPELISLTEDFVKVLKNKKESGGKVPGLTQFTGLVAAGQQATCVEELKLFILYKEAKQGTSKEWARLAEPLVKIVGEVCEMTPSDELQLPLVQRFLGYLMWNVRVKVRANGGVK